VFYFSWTTDAAPDAAAATPRAGAGPAHACKPGDGVLVAAAGGWRRARVVRAPAAGARAKRAATPPDASPESFLLLLEDGQW
jgi:hypothetical protein